MTMQVVTYTSEDAPDGFRACARILIPTLSTLKKDQGKLEAHPVVFHGDDPEVVGAKASAWWNAEIKRREEKAAKLAAAVEKRRQARDGSTPMNHPSRPEAQAPSGKD